MQYSDGRFQFLGFWPNRSKDRDALLQDVSSSKKASIFFESPHRIKETLALLANHLEPDRGLLVCRELTKKFEEVIALQAGNVGGWLEDTESLKGEFVIVVAGRPAKDDEAPERASLLMWANALSPYMASKEIAAVLSETLGLTKKEAYQVALDAKSK